MCDNPYECKPVGTSENLPPSKGGVVVRAPLPMTSEVHEAFLSALLLY